MNEPTIVTLTAVCRSQSSLVNNTGFKIYFADLEIMRIFATRKMGSRLQMVTSNKR